MLKFQHLHILYTNNFLNKYCFNFNKKILYTNIGVQYNLIYDIIKITRIEYLEMRYKKGKVVFNFTFFFVSELIKNLNIK